MHAKDELIRELLHNSNGIRVAFRSDSSLGDNLDDMDNNKNILEETTVSSSSATTNTTTNSSNSSNDVLATDTTKQLLDNNDVALFSELPGATEHSEIQVLLYFYLFIF